MSNQTFCGLEIPFLERLNSPFSKLLIEDMIDTGPASPISGYALCETTEGNKVYKFGLNKWNDFQTVIIYNFCELDPTAFNIITEEFSRAFEPEWPVWFLFWIENRELNEDINQNIKAVLNLYESDNFLVASTNLIENILGVKLAARDDEESAQDLLEYFTLLYPHEGNTE